MNLNFRMSETEKNLSKDVWVNPILGIPSYLQAHYMHFLLMYMFYFTCYL